MKVKKIIAGVIAAVCCLPILSFNKDIFDFNCTFDQAIVTINGKTIKLDIEQWTDYEGEQLQLRLTDGSVILVSANYTTLIQTNAKGNCELYSKLEYTELEKAN